MVFTRQVPIAAFPSAALRKGYWHLVNFNGIFTVQKLMLYTTHYQRVISISLI